MDLFIRLAHTTKIGMTMNFTKVFPEMEIPEIVMALVNSNDGNLVELGKLIKLHADKMILARQYVGG